MQQLFGAMVLFFMALLPVAGPAQNLVPNPSFEQYYSCPDGTGYAQVRRLKAWYESSASPDYYNCGAGVPANLFGNQTARTGSAYVGEGDGEHLAVRLLQPLEANKLYRIEFFTSLAESRMPAPGIGVRFSRDSICGFSSGGSPNVVNSPGPVADTIGWTGVSGTYSASGCEQFLEIVLSGTPQSYYYFDDVSVVCIDPVGCTPPDCSHLHDVFIPNVFTPNGDGPNDRFRVQVVHSELPEFTCTVFNRWGRRVAYMDLASPEWDGTLDGDEVPEGVYYYLLEVTVTLCGEKAERHGVVQLLR
ncbi:MAG: gliding motility-associated C-terminal domain-containing protein [Flavobacteriales bacterium]